MKKVCIAALSILLLFLPVLSVSAAEPSYVYTCDFEKLTTANMKDETPIGFRNKSGEMTIETLDGSKVLKILHKKLDKGEDCYVDLITSADKYGLSSVYCLSYDFRYTGTMGCAWQICCSRQIPASGIMFQQAGTIGTDATITFSKSNDKFTLEPDRWYNLAAVMNEKDNYYDLYVDGVLVAEAVPYDIKDTSATLPNLLRIGFSSGAPESIAYVDNIAIYNSPVPYNVAEPEITVLADEKDVIADFPLPQYTSDVSISGSVWYILGTTASLALAIVGYALLRKLNIQK